MAGATEHAGAFVVLHPDLIGGQPERLGQHPAHAMGKLGRAHDERAVRPNVRERATRRERRVRLVGTVVGRRGDVCGAGEGRRDIAGLDQDAIGRFRRPHDVEQLVLRRQPRRHVPGDLELFSGANRVPFPLGDDTDEIAFAHHARAGNIGNRAFIDARDFGAKAVGALPARTHDAAVQHVGHSDVLHVHVLATDLVGDIDARHVAADKLVVGDRLLRRLARHLHVELPVADECAVGDGTGRIAVDRHHALRHPKTLDGRAELLGCKLQQRLPRFGRGSADLRAIVHDREACDRRALVRRHVGIDARCRKLAHVEVKLLAGNLQHAGGGALAKLDFADQDRRGVVRMDRDP